MTKVCKSYTPAYRIWSSVKQRAGKARKGCEQYITRTICSFYSDSFDDFLGDVGPRRSRHLSLDRLNNEDGYHCGRCAECKHCPRCRSRKYKTNLRWATRTQQQRNKSNNNVLQFRGKKLCITEWAEKTGLSRNTIDSRLNRGWSVRKALTTPRKREKTYKLDGVRHSLKEWCDLFKKPLLLVWTRVHRLKWSIRRALET